MSSDNASRRFNQVWGAIKNCNNSQASSTRESLLKAYGNPKPEAGSDEIWRNEKDVAESCLKGEGADTSRFLLMAYDENNLISVLAKELGLVKTGMEEISRPWLGGDWVSMAEFIVHITRKQLDDEDVPNFPKEPLDMIRVFQVNLKDDAGRGNSGIYIATPKAGGKTMDNQAIHLRSTKPKSDLMDIEWISICVPPNKLHLISEQLPNQKLDGVPENLWEPLAAGTEPGTEKPEDYEK